MSTMARLTGPMRNLLLVVLIYHLAIWMDLIATLQYWGFDLGADPVELGILVMSFSGSMAFAGALFEGRVRTGQRFILIAAALGGAMCMEVYPLFPSVAFGIIPIIVKGGLIGLMAGAHKACMERLCVHGELAKVDELFEWCAAAMKFAGPLVAVIIIGSGIGVIPVHISSSLYVLAALAALFLPKLNGEAASIEYPVDTEPRSDSLLLIAGLVALAAMSLFVTVGDSQLVILFRDVYAWNDAVPVALVMAAAGIGTYLVRFWQADRRSFVWVGISCLALAAAFFVLTGGIQVRMPLIWVLLVFLVAGVFWQAGFTVYLRKISGDEAGSARFGIIMAATYISGPLFGGIMVKMIGIQHVYQLAGLSLLGIALAFGIIYAARQTLTAKLKTKKG
ncbi:hypothetical protein V3851_05245 [Paenibacillus sp. M1]|uniref:MFS transporter n=1 Tax=Paenibacillus haidiansis TaxID=1574488 RepID=A0ABU7VNB2_9BACL